VCLRIRVITTAIDGFTIQNGASYWNEDDYPHPGTGAGILVMSGAKPTIPTI